MSYVQQPTIKSQPNHSLKQSCEFLTETYLLTETIFFSKYLYWRLGKKESIDKYNIDIKQPYWFPSGSSQAPFRKASFLHRADGVFRFGSPSIRILLHREHQLWSTNSNFCDRKISCTCISCQERKRELPENGLDCGGWQPSERDRFQLCCESGFRSKNRCIFCHRLFPLRSIRSKVSNNRSWCTCSRSVIPPRRPWSHCRGEETQLWGWIS